MQVGAIGLIKAIDRFDPDHGVGFTTFALPTIFGEVRRHFRDTTWAVHVPRRLRELRIGLAKAQEQLSQQLDRAPTATELGEHLSFPREEVAEGLTAGDGCLVGSLGIGAGTGEEDGLGPLAAGLGVEDRWLAKVVGLISLEPLIAALPQRERLILSVGFTEGLTQSRIGDRLGLSQFGDRLGLSQMHVSRLFSRTLRRLGEGLTCA
ncbi:RNA polymerase sigma factor (sigma-70 family) [Streptomyces sp. 1114.5]|nr:RNA polymerase sigma factor (sigma-70 family) [Streptomyces sp. 1114.5]